MRQTYLFATSSINDLFQGPNLTAQHLPNCVVDTYGIIFAYKVHNVHSVSLPDAMGPIFCLG